VSDVPGTSWAPHPVTENRLIFAGIVEVDGLTQVPFWLILLE
jgi:hypothetical protein